jgi:hypothetical protein
VKIYSGTSATVNVPGYEQYNINFGCQDFKVQLNTMAPRQSPILRISSGNDGLCPASQGFSSGATTDFSNELGGSTNTITISNARYDAYCQIWWQQWSYYQYSNPSYWQSVYSFMCPMKNVHPNHTINGTVCIQVNGQRECP